MKYRLEELQDRFEANIRYFDNDPDAWNIQPTGEFDRYTVRDLQKFPMVWSMLINNPEYEKEEPEYDLDKDEYDQTWHDWYDGQILDDSLPAPDIPDGVYQVEVDHGFVGIGIIVKNGKYDIMNTLKAVYYAQRIAYQSMHFDHIFLEDLCWDHEKRMFYASIGS